MKIGVIGLGNMGGPMAANLARAGHEVSGYAPIAPYPDDVTEVKSGKDAARGQDVVLTMLPDGPILQAVAADILPVMKPDSIFLDCSTVDVDSARAVASQSAEAGVLPLDAPVSGGTGGATAGPLTFLDGGSV